MNFYSTINDLLDKLTQLYDDSDKETNFRRKYANLSQEKSKFSDFYSMFQRLFFYLEYHEKQLIVDLRDKIVYRLRAAWSSQLIQSESLNEIRDYLIHLNNEHRVMNDIKEKKSLIKVRKQVIFAEKWDSLNSYKKIKVTTLVNHSKSCDATLTSIKETDLQTESCFIYHKSDYFSKECSDWILRINALEDDEFDQFTLNFESDSDSKKLAISFKVIKEIKIISLCSQIKVLLKENYFKKSFLINVSFIFQSNSFSLRSLIDSDFVIYTLIHDKLVNKIYQKLEIQYILLA